MKKFLLSTFCIALVTVLCMGYLNAQNQMKRAPEPGDIKVATQVEKSNFLDLSSTFAASTSVFRGNNCPVIYTTATTSTAVGVFKSTVGTVGSPATQLATITQSYQAMGRSTDGTIYVTIYTGSNNRFGTLNPETGTFTQIGGTITNADGDLVSIACNPVTGTMYATNWPASGGSRFGTLNVATGRMTYVGSALSGIGYITFDDAGTCYCFIMNATTGGRFGTINITTGAFTEIATYPTELTNYIQQICVDPLDNELYHATRYNAGSGHTEDTEWVKIDKTTGARTLVATFPTGLSVESFVIIPGTPSNDVTITTNVNPAGAGTVTGGGTQPSGSNFSLQANANAGYTFQNWTPGNATTNPLVLTNVTANATYTANFTPVTTTCNAPTNLNVAYNGTTCTTATLTWTAPTKDRAVLCDNTNINVPTSGNNGLISSYWAGANSWVFCADDFTADAIWTIEKISTRGFQSPGNPPSVPPSTQPTKMSIVIYQDNGNKPGTAIYTNHAINVTWDAPTGFADTDIILPTPFTLPATGKYWISIAGAYDGAVDLTLSRWNIAMGTTGIGTNFHLHDPGNLFGAGTAWMDAGPLVSPGKSMYFKIEGTIGGGPSPVTYNVYCDGNQVNTTPITTTSYDATTVDLTTAHTWSVKAICPTGGESAAATKAMEPCAADACAPAKNLAIETWEDCRNILTWEKPDGKKSNVVFTPAPIVQPYIPTPEEIEMKAKVEEMAANANRRAEKEVNETPEINKIDIPRAPKGMVNVTLVANNVWLDGTGYQLLLDQTALQYGQTIPLTGPIWTDPSGGTNHCGTVPATLYDVFSHKIPTTANPSCNPPAANWIVTGSATIQIPAGTYDWCITNPEPGYIIWIAGGTGNNAGRRDNYLFEDGYKYTFTMARIGDGDGVYITIEEDGDPCPAVTGVTATQVTNTQNVNITWNAPATGTPTEYQVLRNDTPLATVPVGTTTYTHVNAPVGTQNYCVKAVFPASANCVAQKVCAPALNVNEVFTGGCEGKIVGTGTTSSNQYPINTYYDYSYTQQIYDEAAIGKIGEITQLGFQFLLTTAVSYPIVVYIGQTTKSTFTGTSDFIPLSQMTKVFEGNINLNATLPWSTIEIVPFLYTGGNLVVAVQSLKGSWIGSTPSFRNTAVTGNKTVHWYRDGSAINMNNPMEGSPSGAAVASRANMRFVICPMVEYNVYRNGTLLATVNKPTYTDFTADYTIANEYCIKVICEDGVSLSAPICKTVPICKPAPCGIVQNLAAEYGLDCAFAKITWDAPILPKVNSGGYVPVYNGPFGVETPEAEKMGMENPFTGTPVSRRAPKQMNFGTSKTEFVPAVPFRGNNSPLLYSVMFTGVYMTTLGQPGGTHTQIGTMPSNISYQAMERVGDVVYIIRYNEDTGGNSFGTLNTTTGVFTLINANSTADGISMALHPTTGEVYVTQWGTSTSTPFGKVNLANGNFINIGPISQGQTYIAIDNNGVCYAVTPTNFGTVNLSTGAFTSISSYSPGGGSIQDLYVDRETNELYHINLSGQLLRINKATGATTNLGTFPVTQVESWIIISEAKPPCPAVTNVTATVVPGTKNVKVSWSPATGSPTAYKVTRDGTEIYSGLLLTYTDEGASPGSRTYCVKAEYPAANDCAPVSVCAPAVTVPELLPNGCEYKIVGTATTGEYRAPLNTYWNYSYTQQIYDEAAIGSTGNISAISFEYIHPTPEYATTVNVYMAHTTKSTFASNTDFVPLSQLTLVYSGPMTFNSASKWSTITLTNEFEYTGGNLVVAIQNNKGSNLNNTTSSFRYSATTGNKTIWYYRDSGLIAPADPNAGSVFTTGSPAAGRPNTRFIICEDQKAYNIYRDGVLIAENYLGNEYIDDIANGMKPDEPHCWVVKYVRKGDHNLECPDGAEICLAQCAPEPPCVTKQVGTGTVTTYNVPVNTYYNYSYTQQIYDAAEIGATGNINSISFKYVHTVAAPNYPLVVYVGTTTQSTFTTASNYVPLASLTKVFEGTVNFTNNPEWTTIDLDLPYPYAGGNLVVAVVSNKGSYLGTAYVFHGSTTTGNKTLQFYQDASAINPASPSASNSGVLTTRPNIKFEICEDSGIDMAATSILLCPSKVKTQTPYDVEVTVRNNGDAPAANYKVQILDYPSMAIIKEVTIAEPLAPKASITHTISDVIFTTSGEKIIRGRVDLADDSNPLNNQTGNFNITVRPLDLDEVVEIPCPANVGAGQITIPFNWYYRSSMVQSLYTEAEIGLEGGYIKDITWFYNHTGTANLNNRPIKVYLAVTDQTSLAGGWLPLANFTMVYEGMASVPMGVSELTVTLTNPFLYMGGNLVIMTERILDPLDYINNVNAMTTVVTPAGRTRHYYSDSAPFNFTQAGNVVNFISNVRLTINVPPHGKIKGTASCQEIPVEGVQVVINEIPGASRITDATGYYYYGFVPLGTYSMLATKFAYFDGYANDIAVKANQTETVDFNAMCLLPEWTVWGAVANAAGDLLEGAKVELKGYENYTTTTAYNGAFDFPNVYAPKTYTLTVTLKGYQDYKAQVFVAGHVNLGTIVLLEVPAKPTCVVAVEVAPFVDITWEAPGACGSKTYILDDGSAESGWRINPDSDASLGNRFNVDEDGYLTSIDLYGMQAQTSTGRLVTVDIYNEARQLVGTSEPFVIPPGAWINVPLNDIEYSGTFYAMVHWPNTSGNTWFLGFDTNGPNALSGLCYYYDPTDGWEVFNNLISPPYDKGIFVLRANAVVEGKKVSYGYNEPKSNGITANIFDNITHTNVSAVAGNPPVVVEKGGTRGITGYKLWRLVKGQETKPETWITLTNLPVPAMNFTDVTWPTAAMDTHRWAVRTCYHGGVESAPAFSNPLYKNVEVIYTIDITTNSGHSPAGALVELKNAGKTYTSPSTSTGVTFPTVLCGKYTLTITFEGFKKYTDTAVIVAPSGSHHALLLVDSIAPKNVVATVDTCNARALLTWSHEAGAAFTGFTVYLNNVIVKTGLQVKEYMFTNLDGNYKAGVVANYGSVQTKVVEKEFNVTCLGVKEIEGNYEIYPNPTMDRIYVHRESDTPAFIEVYDAMGKFIQRVETTEKKYELNVTSYANGTYFIRVTKGANTGVKSFVKQ